LSTFLLSVVTVQQMRSHALDDRLLLEVGALPTYNNHQHPLHHRQHYSRHNDNNLNEMVTLADLSMIIGIY